MKKNSSVLAGFQLVLLGSCVIASTHVSLAQQLPAQTNIDKQDKNASASLSEQEQITLRQITITAARTTGSVLDIPMTVNIISGADLERRVVRDIQDMVRYEPGVSVNRTTSMTNPFGQLNSFSIRGVGGNRVQMLVDGSRIQEQITDGSRDFVDPFNMKAIEIIRGPNSVLSGADALGGVVSFRTIDPEDILQGDRPWGGEIKLGYDSYDSSFRKQITAAAQAGDFKILGSFGHVGSSEIENRKGYADGGIWGCPRQDIWPCNKPFPADTSAYNGLMKLQWTPNTDHKLMLTGEWFDRETSIDQVYDSSSAMMGYNSDSWDRDLEMRRYRFALEHEWQVDKAWLDEVKWKFSYSPQKRDTLSEQLRSYATRKEQRIQIRNYGEEFIEADLQLTSSFSLGASDHKLIYGFDGDFTKTTYEGTDITNNLTDGSSVTGHNKGFNFPRVNTTRADLFLQDEIKLLDERWTITPGLRLASYSIDPSKDENYVPLPGYEPHKINTTRLIKRLSTTYKLSDTYSLYGSYGEGFKMPTSQQLFISSLSIGSTGMVEVIPNPDLKPEFVRSYEAGIRGELDRGYFSVTGFYADYKDFIRSLQPVAGATDRYTSDNVDSVQVWGIELGGEYEIYNNLFANAALSYQRGSQRVDAGSEKTAFDGASPLSAVAGLRYLIPDWKLETEVIGTFAKGVSRRADPDAYKPAGYAVFDVYAKWKPTDMIDVNLGVQNIFDKRYFPNTLAGNYLNTPASSAVANQNPLEMQVAPGRTYKLGATVRF